MGLMLNGTYLVDDPGPDSTAGGEFQRARSNIRDFSRRSSRALPMSFTARASWVARTAYCSSGTSSATSF